MAKTMLSIGTIRAASCRNLIMRLKRLDGLLVRVGDCSSKALRNESLII